MILFILIILVILIILIISFYLLNLFIVKKEKFIDNIHNKYNKHNQYNNISILLTCTVNVDNNIDFLFQKDKIERKKLYIDRIKKWLYNTNFNIIVVENSDEKFSELKEELKIFKDRFEIFSFNTMKEKDAKYLYNNKSKGAFELYSIQYAYKKSKILKKSDFIIKITGRYFIDKMQDFLSKKNIKNYIALRQNDNLKCEIVGTNIKYFNYIFNLNPIYKDIDGNIRSNNAFVERVYKERIDRLPYDKVITCPIFNIEPTQQGGLNKIRTFL